MTYSNEVHQTGTSSGLAQLRDASSTTAGLNAIIQWATVDTFRGSSVCSVSSGVITLPAGYYYLLEGVVGCLSTSAGWDAHFQFYDENASAYVGTKAYLSGDIGTEGEHYDAFSMDDCARLWVDATSSAGSISLREQAVVGPLDRFDTAGPGGRQNTGYSRCLVWRFD
ncbi:MAG: hypothetical protein CMM54_00020 [Rhodospirillaceae bacterium]|nr:hypothetical protein [Rhodospirillaceae bacterium]